MGTSQLMDHILYLECMVCGKQYDAEDVEYVCPDHRKGYPDERFYSSPEDPVYVVKVRGKDREIAYRASHLERCLEAHA